MPPTKPVQKLQNFAKEKVLFNVCAVILDEIFFSEDESWEVYGPPRLSVRLGLVKDFIAESLSPPLLEDLLNTILSRDETVEATVRYLALQLLLVEGVRTLTVGNFPESYYTLVLEAAAKSGNGLHNLDLRGIWVKNEHKNYLLKLLRKLAFIKRLTLRYNCDDDMLAALGKYCYHLQRLDVGGSKAITEAGLKNLCLNPSRVAMDSLTQSLQIVDIGGPGSQGLPPSLASYLLLTLPNLISLGSYEQAGAAVEIAMEKRPGKPLGLRYLHDTITSNAKFLAISRMCPKLQSIYLDSPKNTAVHNLEILKDLREVKLHKVRWSDIKIMLDRMGTRVKHLFLLYIFGEVDLCDLGCLCIHLERLEVHGSTFICSRPLEPVTFQDLRELLIYKSQISTGCMRQLLSQCVTAEHVALGECDLTDDSLITCLLDRGLTNVRDLWFGYAQNLTFQAVEAILEHCPNITNLGNLASWSVHPAEIDLLRVQLLLTNADLVIHDIGSDEDQWIAIEL